MTAPFQPPTSLAIDYRGACMLRGKEWLISCEPDVMLVLKRVFQRVEKGQTGQVRLQRSEEVDRDLQWFMDRFPLEMTSRDAAELHRGAEEHRERARRVKRILSGNHESAPVQMAVVPRDYQRQAAAMWMEVGGLLLADELGTGKTISAITALSDPRLQPALIVVPGHNLAKQWKVQLERCLPGCKVYICFGTKDLGHRLDGYPDFVICPYHLLEYWCDIVRPKTKALVYDEVSELRHDETKKYTAARGLSGAALWVMGMSATPAWNYGAEYHAIYDVIRPGCLGSWEEFDREWCVIASEKRKNRIKDPRAFGHYLDKSGLRLARTRRDIGRELPRLISVPVTIDPDPGIYATNMTGAAAFARQILATGASGFSKMKAGGELDKMMRKATGLAKAPAVAGFVRMLVESGERPVVFAHHHGVYDTLQEHLKDLHPGYVTGRESDKQKAESIRRFTTRDENGHYDTDVLILGLRAQATGLDGLQFHSSVVVHAELDWSGKVHEQATGRVDRDLEPIARNRSAVCYWLLTDIGSDPIISDVIGAKAANTTPISYPDADRLVEPMIDEARARRLAESYLQRQR